MAGTDRTPARLAISAVATLALAGCASAPPPGADDDARRVAAAAPERWYAPLPHDGQAGELMRWWQQFDDPLLPALVDAAQQASPSVAAAAARIEQARAAAVGAGAALLPALSAGASVTRGRQDISTPLATVGGASVQAGWELDLFGGLRAGRDAALSRWAGADALWHEARVSLAAEVASAYTQLRSCEAQREKTAADAASRGETARLTELSAKAGFQAPADAALARAGAAQSRSQLAAQQAQCEQLVKSLVALSGWDEPALRARLSPNAARMPAPAGIVVDAVPAQALAQRPDLYAAARELEAAAADTEQARAERLPSVTLAGSVGRSRLRAAGITDSATVWSLGPLQVSLPLFDGGTRVANVDAARARYTQAASQYRATLRDAVREVEDALVTLDGTAQRSADARTAIAGFEESLQAARARFERGAGSLFELEDARRSALQAQSNLIELQRERVASWITLYRALGGGWAPMVR